MEQWHEIGQRINQAISEMDRNPGKLPLVVMTYTGGSVHTWTKLIRYGYTIMQTTSLGFYLGYCLKYPLSTLYLQNSTIAPIDGSLPSNVSVAMIRTPGLRLRVEVQPALIPYTPACISLRLNSSGHGWRILHRFLAISARPFVRGFVGVFIIPPE